MEKLNRRGIRITHLFKPGIAHESPHDFFLGGGVGVFNIKRESDWMGVQHGELRQPMELYYVLSPSGTPRVR